MKRQQRKDEERYAAALERLVYASPEQIVRVHKPEAHLAAEAALATKQAAEREDGEIQPAHPAQRN